MRSLYRRSPSYPVPWEHWVTLCRYLRKKISQHQERAGSYAGRLSWRTCLEEIVFDTVTTGAANDIEQATKVARAMITQYGMSEKFGLMGLATQENQYLKRKSSFKLW